MDIVKKIAAELAIRPQQVEATIKLIDEGNTIPFIARYRKEVTGSLNDEVLRNLDERLTYLRGLQERKETVLASIKEQGKLTEELEQKIAEAETLVAVEDLYRPYKQKRKTRASVAIERGLEPLADLIFSQSLTGSAEEAAANFIDPEKEVPTAKDAIAGALDIIAERISDEAEYRSYIRNATMEEGVLVSGAKDKEVSSVYEMYYEFSESVSKAQGYRVLALNRGEKEKILTVKVEAPTERILRYLEKQVIEKEEEESAGLLKAAVEDSYNRLIAPAIEREVRNELTEKAEDGAITVFGQNLKQLLMQPPIAGRVVLGWDPAFRTGCKLAVVDETGKVLDTTVIYPTEPQNKVEQSKEILKKLIKKYHISLISVGNGTASRESEQIIAQLLSEIDEKVEYVIVNEAGASVYSASKLATEEFPNFDVGQRSAASIARRLQDPLAELVKIDPKSIGVGQYQHDLNQKKLSDTLGGVVEDCVNKVGVDLNTASASLLTYISGISKPVAKNIVDYREANGRFTDRRQLLKVPKLGTKAFEQCAGFLRISGGKNPLDATSVHPESYQAVGELLNRLELTMDEVLQMQKKPETLKLQPTEKRKEPKKEPGQLNLAGLERMGMHVRGSKKVPLADSSKQKEQQKSTVGTAGRSPLAKKVGDTKAMAGALGIGEPTLLDIIGELEKPSRDPREDMPKPVLRSDILDMKDLKPGMILKGTVRNAVDFGAFVDIGVHQDGLVHISQISDSFIKHPLEAVSVGDVVDVKVMSVDVEKNRIQLTMKLGK
ncbi:MAG: RNA-binding transcriptional accessory protein [Lachnospiraceae bacterium]|nr:RNA-binding transcriptional accessory protein [Lachnospiraceae bacterium]